MLGGKAFNLALLDRATRSGEAFKIPSWFALTSEAFEVFVRPLLLNGASPEIIQNFAFPPELKREIEKKMSFVFPTQSRFAVRSSAVSEDSSEHSFAGQYSTELGVRLHGIEAAIKSVWSSLFSGHALDNAAKAGAGSNGAMAVIIQELIEPRVSGVAFSIDPVTGERCSVISAVFGLGEGLVSGLLDADTFTVSGNEVRSQIVEKRAAIRPSATGGTVTEGLEESISRAPTLSEDEARSITRMVQELEAYYGTPQDSEWAIATDGTLYLLQARPITAIAKSRNKEETILWDNSNIIESFSGTTTPLTFAFVSEVYREVYKQFVHVLGVPKKVIQDHAEIFSMVGYIRGRIYYNLANWYRVVSLLPFYEANAHFMEQMMGVSEGINVEPIRLPKRGKLRSLTSSGAAIAVLVLRLLRLNSNTRLFHGRLRRVLDERHSISTRSSVVECLAHYSDLERELLQRWTTPIVNDFFVMVFFGLLRKLIGSWKLAGTIPADAMANDLISSEGGMISAAPGREIERIAANIEASSARECFALPDDLVMDLIEKMAPERSKEIAAYIHRFGDRWQHELKLETITPAEEPSLIIGLLRSHLQQSAAAPVSEPRDINGRWQAEAVARQGLRGKPLKRALFFFILSQARIRITARENLRFERTRVFARVRAIYLQIGREFTRSSWISEPRDIFFLTRIEISEAVQAGEAIATLKEVIHQRKIMLFEFESINLPARFRTDGFEANGEYRIVPEAILAADGSLRGIGCAPGIIRGVVRIVREPHVHADLRGKIIVAERTDPGWAPIFPLAKGLLVERGSLLSHSAIVARELGLPTIVGIPNLLAILSDGDEVEFDGTTGIVRKVEMAETRGVSAE